MYVKNIYVPTLVFAFFVLGAPVHAQWYFETGLATNDFNDYTVTRESGDTNVKTTFVPYEGVRDISYGIGYLFSFSKNKEEDGAAAQPEPFRPPVFRLGVGLGFDQMNIRTNAYFNQAPSPTNVNYYMGQLQANAGVYLTPLVLYTDVAEQKRPFIALNVFGGAAFNKFTSAVLQKSISSVDLLAVGNDFASNYISIHYGAGLQFFLNNNTQLYIRQTLMSSQDIEETSVTDDAVTKANYSFGQSKFSLGLLFDLKLSERSKKQQQEKIAGMEKQIGDTSALLARVDQLSEQNSLLTNQVSQINTELETLKTGIVDLKGINDESLMPRMHGSGVGYFPEFTHVNFDIGSSYFDEETYSDLFTKMAKILKDNPKLSIRLVGYADESGSEAYNLELSKNRAFQVRNYLVDKHGISADRIFCGAAGETNHFSIINPKHNRRTEIAILHY
jgi:outer membrane protein OmpA-like peptidoglycan-associated protein